MTTPVTSNLDVDDPMMDSAGVADSSTATNANTNPNTSVTDAAGNPNLGVAAQYGRMGLGLGGMQSGRTGIDGLPTVSDPDDAYAEMTRRQYLNYRNNFEPFEDELIERAQTDTSLIDQARVDAPQQTQRAADIAARNRQRYGVNLTPAQRAFQQGALQRAGVLGEVGALSNARIAQADLNRSLIAGLVNIGQGVSATAMDQLGGAARNATQRRQAYESAKAANRAQTIGTIGSLTAGAILAGIIP